MPVDVVGLYLHLYASASSFDSTQWVPNPLAPYRLACVAVLLGGHLSPPCTACQPRVACGVDRVDRVAVLRILPCCLVPVNLLCSSGMPDGLTT